MEEQDEWVGGVEGKDGGWVGEGKVVVWEDEEDGEWAEEDVANEDGVEATEAEECKWKLGDEVEDREDGGERAEEEVDKGVGEDEAEEDGVEAEEGELGDDVERGEVKGSEDGLREDVEDDGWAEEGDEVVVERVEAEAGKRGDEFGDR